MSLIDRSELFESKDNIVYIKKRLANTGFETKTLNDEVKNFLKTKPREIFDAVSDVLDLDEAFIKYLTVKFAGKPEENAVPTMYSRDPTSQEEWLTMDFPDTYPKDHETKVVNLSPAERAKRATVLNRHVENELHAVSLEAPQRANFIDYELDKKLNY